MYNVGSFNEQGFNVLFGNDDVLYITEAMTETVDAMVSNSGDIHENIYGIEQYFSNSSAANGDLVTASISEAVNAEINSFPDHDLIVSCAEDVDCSAFASEDSYISGSLSEICNTDIFLSVTLYYSEALEAALGKAILAAADYYDADKAIYEIVYGSVGTSKFTYKYIAIDVTIPPGSTLIIDSENYNVLLDGENVIDKHSGDWLDELTRNTFDITLGSGVVGDLEGSLLYTERYL